jgi:hypothetical protein
MRPSRAGRPPGRLNIAEDRETLVPSPRIDSDFWSDAAGSRDAAYSSGLMENILSWIAAQGYAALFRPLMLGTVGARFPDDSTLALAGRLVSVDI